MKTRDLPAKIVLDNGTVLRFFEENDAAAVARAVGESLEHLKPWMPWADRQSADAGFQRERLRKQPHLAERGEEWQYGLFPEGGSNVLGSFGLMTRRGPGTIEIGYWVHVDAVGHGYATRAVEALTELALQREDVRRVLIYCDEANVRSAAIPERLGYVLQRIGQRAPEAPGETGREMTWALEREQSASA
jgi:RimJ/RimL family protein N-acetyltransferase